VPENPSARRQEVTSVLKESPSGPSRAASSNEVPPLDQLPEGALGIPASHTHPPLQQDSFKELINKLAWTLGSTYRAPYSGKRSPAREYALRIARQVMKDNGYPRQIGKFETD